MSWILWLLAAAIGFVVTTRLGVFSGSAPTDLGVRDGRLKAPSTRPNSVSSQTALWPGHPQATRAAIAPLPAAGDAAATIERLARAIEATPGARIVERRADYLYAQFTTPLMRYVDDAEFWFDPAANVVQVRSASRIGNSDLGANRARIERLRAALGGG